MPNWCVTASSNCFQDLRIDRPRRQDQGEDPQFEPAAVRDAGADEEKQNSPVPLTYNVFRRSRFTGPEPADAAATGTVPKMSARPAG